MSSQEQKNDKTLGCVLAAIGMPLAVVGVIISLTVIGAIVGIPMALIGGAMFGYGVVKFLKK